MSTIIKTLTSLKPVDYIQPKSIPAMFQRHGLVAIYQDPEIVLEDISGSPEAPSRPAVSLLGILFLESTGESLDGLQAFLADMPARDREHQADIFATMLDLDTAYVEGLMDGWNQHIHGERFRERYGRAAGKQNCGYEDGSRAWWMCRQAGLCWGDNTHGYRLILPETPAMARSESV